jgi:hypothetical protein
MGYHKEYIELWLFFSFFFDKSPMTHYLISQRSKNGNFSLDILFVVTPLTLPFITRLLALNQIKAHLKYLAIRLNRPLY